MQDAHGLYLSHPGLINDARLKGLNLLVSLTGYAEAGMTAQQVTDEILADREFEEVAVFDVDQLYDYRSRRPHIRFIEDHFQDFEMPSLKLYAVKDGLEQTFLLLSGPEPDLQWKRFSQAVTELATRLKVSMVATVSAVPMPVPHTRPLSVTAHGNRLDLIQGISPWRPIAEFGAAFTHVLEADLGESGFDTVGFTVNVPQYLSEAELPQSAVVALEHLGAATRLNLPTDRLREASRDAERQIDDQVEGSPEIQALVAHLEQRYDENVTENMQKSLLAREEAEFPDADELGATIEAYLAEHDGEDQV